MRTYLAHEDDLVEEAIHFGRGLQQADHHAQAVGLQAIMTPSLNFSNALMSAETGASQHRQRTMT